MAELITVPTFTFDQGSFYKGDNIVERPIRVEFYNDSISLVQEGDFNQPETIMIHPNYLNELFRAIKKHLPEAKETLKRTTK